ncbi:hypothetical protein K402DRAFT_390463 [Aulographum hederae CBS 113979]|uniref:Mso1 N-terminal domain-containing protein n=1 Tax=Aulographum hederae CBS 113979 TaxID=1176131 RepID=A0A6G1HAC7_9PEZI|nr:hypothetical protein K402DRAFT_390463 [Aulographum hederae CBS 113979]
MFSNLLTTTTSRYNALRQALTSSEADGDTEDDTHISRVLRAYYTEKSRPFPSWLPPDPKAPQPLQTTASFVSSRNSSQAQQQGMPPGSRGGSTSGLGDLFGDSRQGSLASQPMSLRQGRSGPGNFNNNSMEAQGALPPRRTAGIVESYTPSGAPQPSSSSRLDRPLASQRAGSWQSQNSATGTASGRPSFDGNALAPQPSGGSAQERLRARIWGAGRNSPAPTQTAGAGGDGGGRASPYGDAGRASPYGDAVGGRASPYADTGRASPYAAPGRERGGGSSYAGGSADDGYGRSGETSGGGAPQRRIGLPTGPRSGLPSGPRPQR